MQHAAIHPAPILPPRRRTALMSMACGTALFYMLGGMLPAQAANPAPPVASDSRVKTFVFNENDVYSLLTYYGFQSNVEFGPKERIETVSIGDRAGWQVVPAGRRLFIRAVADDLHTNMTVITNERAYQFDLRATNPADLPQEELAYVIRFYYPDDPKNARTPGAMVPAAAPAPQAYPMGGNAYGAAAVAYPTGNAAPATMHYNAGSMASDTPAPAVEPAPAMPMPVSAVPLAAPHDSAQSHSLPAPQPKPSLPAAMRSTAMQSPPPTTATKNRYGAGPYDTPLPAASVASNIPANNIAAAPSPLPPTANSAALNFNYTYEGSGQILPYAMFDDGQRTYFQFLNASSAPKLFRVTREGKEIAVPLNREDKYWVAGGVGAKFVLRSGEQKATIYNETRQNK